MLKSFFLFLSTLISLSVAAVYQSPGIQEGECFQRTSAPVFLRSRGLYENPADGIARYDFAIVGKEGSRHPNQVVGNIVGTYSELGRHPSSVKEAVEIPHLEVYSGFRGHQYGEAALRTLIGVFRSPKRQALNFNRFELCVGLYAERAAARHIYEKVGFTVRERTDFGYAYMQLAR